MIKPNVFDNLPQVSKIDIIQTFLLNNFYQFLLFLEYTDISKYSHSEIITCLQSPGARKLITVPRGCFKSSIASIAYPLWRVLKQPNLRILIDTEVYGNSITYLRSVKAHMKSYSFQQIFGDLEGDVWQEGAITFNTRTKTLKEASITCGAVGTTKVGQHYDIIIGDDYNSASNSRSKESARGVIDHYRYNLSILEPTGEYIIIGTRYSENDLIGFILRDILNCKELAEGNFNF